MSPAKPRKAAAEVAARRMAKRKAVAVTARKQMQPKAAVAAKRLK